MEIDIKNQQIKKFSPLSEAAVSLIQLRQAT